MPVFDATLLILRAGKLLAKVAVPLRSQQRSRSSQTLSFASAVVLALLREKGQVSSSPQPTLSRSFRVLADYRPSTSGFSWL